MKPPFPWLEPHVSRSYAATFPAKRREAEERELEDRAALLMRLGFAPAEIAVRLRAHLQFDEATDLMGRVDAIVAAVEARRGATRHGDPPVE